MKSVNQSINQSRSMNNFDTQRAVTAKYHAYDRVLGVEESQRGYFMSSKDADCHFGGLHFRDSVEIRPPKNSGDTTPIYM